jgi:glyoxylase-like metal-dependent hydrolase (beta-lactamase superfamily II)
MRITIGCVILGAVLANATARAQEQDFSKVEIKVTRVGGSVYMLEGAGGNIAASVGDDGIVIVDDQFAPLADKIRAALKGIADQPVRFVINTHYHGDHVGGNVEFQKEATIIAHHNVRKRISTAGAGGVGTAMEFKYDAAAKEALPVITFATDVSVHVNGEEVQALHVPHGHTDGDSLVYFTKSNVVHMGDDFVRYGFPFIDLLAGGSVQGMIAGLEGAIARLPADVKVIPGHGGIATLDDVRAYVTMLKETRAVVEKGVRAGKTLAQLKDEKVLDAWQKWSGSFIDTNLFIETLYLDLTDSSKAKLHKHN